VKLAAPSHIAVHDGVATVDKLVLQASGGTLLLAGKAGASVLDMKIDIAKLPLSIASFVKPGLELAGTLSARASVSGTPAAPRGRYDISIGGLETAQTRNAAFGAFRVSADGTLNGKTTAVKVTVDGPQNARLTVSGTAPLSTSGSLSLAVNGKLDLSMLNSFLAATGDSVSGPVTVDLHLTGPATAPSAQGTIRVAGAAYGNRAAGLRLDDINATLTGSTKALEINSLSARTQNGGTITGSGRIILDPSAGFPGTLKLKAANAQLVATDIVTATANLDLTIDGSLMKKPTVGGKISVRTMEVNVPNKLPAQAATTDVKHVNAPPRVRKQLAREAAKTAGEEAQKVTAFKAALDITVSAPNRVFIRGRGIDAEVGGQIKVTGTTGNPQAVGTFTMRRGTFTMLTQRLTFTRGNVTFAGGLDPVLDMLAETQADSITAQVSITGRASNPKFDFSSVPSLPRDEVLSRLLFKKASGQLSPFEAVQLARAVAQLTGLSGGGGGVLEEIRKSLGLDALDITNNAEGGPAVGVGRYINDRIYLGVQQGAQAGSSRVTVNVDVTKHIKVQGQVAPDGESKAGVAVEWNY
jgi:translocation and assembly module TamB